MRYIVIPAKSRMEGKGEESRSKVCNWLLYHFHILGFTNMITGKLMSPG